MSNPINDAIVEIKNRNGIDKPDLTDIKPANVSIISEGTTGNTFSNKIRMNMAV